MLTDRPSSAWPDMSSPLLSPLDSEMASLIIPFDTGNTYIFRAESTKQAKVAHPAGEVLSVDAQWSDIFATIRGGEPDWDCCAQFSADLFHKPLSWSVTLPVNTGAAAAELRSIFHGIGIRRADMRVILFPLGISALVIRLKLHDATSSTDWDHFWTMLEDPARQYCETLMRHAAGRYETCMKAAAERGRNVRRLGPVARSRGTYNPQFMTAVFYTSAAPKAAEDNAIYTSVTYPGGVLVRIGWTRTFVSGGTRNERGAIETDHIIATISWFALAVMNRMSSLHLLDSVFAMGERNTRVPRIEARAIRLTYMEGANASHPIRWTLHEPDLLLLEAIHRRWSTGRWWNNVDERTDLLSVHYDQLEADADERRSFKLSLVAAAFACTALVSAVADLLQIASPAESFPKVQVAIGVPAIVTILLWLWYTLSERKHKASE